jgi:hypothetical protein
MPPQGVFSEERTEPFLLFLQRLAELKAVMFRRLATTVEEDLHNSSLLRELTEKRKNAQDELETLQQNLATERKEKDRCIRVCLWVLLPGGDGACLWGGWQGMLQHCTLEGRHTWLGCLRL